MLNYYDFSGLSSTVIHYSGEGVSFKMFLWALKRWPVPPPLPGECH